MSELHERADHPFKVRRDTQMDELVGSIKEIGVMQPGMARPRKEGGYEVLAGYRRWLGCEIAGLSEMPFIVGNYDDDTAIRIMIHTNKYRDSFLPSEKARAYKMDYEAAKRQGKRNGGKKTLEEMAEEFGESWKTIQRFIWLARLRRTPGNGRRGKNRNFTGRSVVVSERRRAELCAGDRGENRVQNI